MVKVRMPPVPVVVLDAIVSDTTCYEVSRNADSAVPAIADAKLMTTAEVVRAMDAQIPFRNVP